MNKKEDLGIETDIDDQKDLPPVGGTWKNLYVLVILILFVQIILYYFITNIFS